MILVNRGPQTLGFERTEGIGYLMTPSQIYPSWVDWVAENHVPWACDNGCFHRFEEDRFFAMLDLVADKPGLLWVAAPDVVGDARATVAYFDHYLSGFIDREIPVALVGQDGMEDCDVDYWFGLADALFVGGSTEWKLSRAAADLMAEAKSRGKWVHMGRVNTRRRIRVAHDLGCDSIDGSAFSWFPEVKIGPAARFIRSLKRQSLMF